MLARNFKTPGELDLSQEVFDALVSALNILERGEIEHIPRGDWRCASKRFAGKHPRKFNMGAWDTPTSCGMVGCIGGLVEAISKVKLRTKYSSPTALVPLGLQELCYPDLSYSYDDITVEQAATALRQYLSTGEANWKSILTSEQGLR